MIVNDFGRIGQLAFRRRPDGKGYEVVAVKDITSFNITDNLSKYNSFDENHSHNILDKGCQIKKEEN